MSNKKRNYSQGRFKPKNPEKYKGDVNNILYRSSWEKKFMVYCDLRDNIVEWSSEENVIPYISPLDGQFHRYFVDFWIKYRGKDGNLHEKIIEVKPSKETAKPKLPQTGRKTKRYIEEAKTYAVNCAKWKFAKNWASDKGMEFQILTEYELGIKKKGNN